MFLSCFLSLSFWLTAPVFAEAPTPVFTLYYHGEAIDSVGVSAEEIQIIRQISSSNYVEYVRRTVGVYETLLNDPANAEFFNPELRVYTDDVFFYSQKIVGILNLTDTPESIANYQKVVIDLLPQVEPGIVQDTKRLGSPYRAISFWVRMGLSDVLRGEWIDRLNASLAVLARASDPINYEKSRALLRVVDTLMLRQMDRATLTFLPSAEDTNTLQQ